LSNYILVYHTTRWLRNFLFASESILVVDCDHEAGVASHRGRPTLVTAHPISVDPWEFDELAESRAVLAAQEEIRARRPERLVVRVDPTDPSKNVVRGFRAFDLYLEAHPEMHRRRGMLALLDPHRGSIPDYAEYLGAIYRTARAVNDRFAQDDWTPIDLQIADN